MRIIKRVLVLAVVVAIPLWMTAAASGKPKPGPGSTTTTTMAPTGLCGDDVIGPDQTSFQVLLTGDEWLECRYVEWPAATWGIEVDSVSGPVNRLTVSVRDAVPGDWCVADRFKKPSAGWLIDWEIPTAAVNGCGADPGQFDDSESPLAFMASFQGGKRAEITITVTRSN